MSKVIEAYVKRNVNGRRRRVGLVVATKDDDGAIRIGYSSDFGNINIADECAP